MRRLLDHFSKNRVKYVALQLAKAGVQSQAQCMKAAIDVKQFEMKTHLSFVVMAYINISPPPGSGV